MKKTLLILGATSSIAKEVAKHWALEGANLVFAGRDLPSIQRIASDFEIRYGIRAESLFFNAESWEEHEHFLKNVLERVEILHGAFLAFGYLGDHAEAIRDFRETKKIFDSNFTGACSICHHLANYFCERRAGFIAVLSSVAGDRGRQSNYVYGAAKSGLSTFLQGLRNRLHPYGVNVITIKPGFIDTAMTYGHPKIPFVTDPVLAGSQIHRAIQRGKSEVYIPSFWRYVMGIIKWIPENIFKRMKL